jgi:diadenosine tetraphosphate (Ap4A) HIT family hydrolase
VGSSPTGPSIEFIYLCIETSVRESFCDPTPDSYTEIMATIYETDNFLITSANRPKVYVDRSEGGHMYIKPKFQVRDRTELSPAQAIEYMKLSMVAGEALKSAMGRRGVDIGIVNYQDMGNWSVFKPEGPTMHLHIYGRATTATIQKYGDAVQLPHVESGFYENFQALDDDDIEEIKADIEKLMRTERYKSPWSEV